MKVNFIILNKLLSDPENILFLNELGQNGCIAVDSLYENIFREIKLTNKFLFIQRDSIEKTLGDVHFLSRFHKRMKIFILIEPIIMKKIFQFFNSVIDKIYMLIGSDFTGEFVDMSRLIIQSRSESKIGTKYKLRCGETFETQYIAILKKIVANKNIKSCRNGSTMSIFGESMKFDLRDGFPLLTTRKIFFRGITEELLFFIRGDTDTKQLEQKGINIWKGNTERKFLDSVGLCYRDGMMGPLYGAQWRHFNGQYNTETGKSYGGVDQLKNIINLIKSDPGSRRILMTSYNPTQVDKCVLYPCHSIVLQFYVDGDFLDMIAYSRSIDWFHGAPFNIASYSLLLILIAKLTGHVARMVNITFGDTHIYTVHENACMELIKKPLYKPPILTVNKDIEFLSDMENLKFEDIILQNYKCHETIKVDMVS